MKLNISYPATGCQKLFEFVDDHKVRIFFDKRIGSEVLADPLGEEWKGYIFKISGGNDKQGFPMKQGVLTTKRVRLLLTGQSSCFRPKRDGQRKRKSVRGCIIDSQLSVISLMIIRKGDNDIEGLTNINIPRRLGPKRASHIRKLFCLSKQDDVRQYVVKRPIVQKSNQKTRFKAPKIQRLITPQILQRKRRQLALKKKRCLKRKENVNFYKKVLAQRHKESKQKLRQLKRRHSASIRSIKSNTDL